MNEDQEREAFEAWFRSAGPMRDNCWLGFQAGFRAALAAQAAPAGAQDEARELRDVLRRNGFVPCDIAACNCGSWHARFGLRQRFDEFTEALSDAGHPLTNENGHVALVALRQLIAERDDLAARQQESN